MNSYAILQLILYIIVLVLLAKPLGWYMAKIFQGHAVAINRLGHPLERFIYKIMGVSPEHEMNWQEYALAVLTFNIIGVVVLYIILRFQQWLPLNPQHFTNLAPDLAFNTAISFTTNTDWQAYVPESSVSYLTQMLGFTVQSFFSAAVAICVVLGLIRGFARSSVNVIGNFWVDMTRTILYVLLPLSLVLSVLLISQGVIQNYKNYEAYSPLESTKQSQLLPMGPVASQEAIKVIGTNGGGFFNANSAHPYENPTPFSNFLQMLAIFLIPVALCFTLGILVGDERQGWTIMLTMLLIFVILTCVALYAEQQGNPLLTKIGVNQEESILKGGGNMEGKETRFGVAGSALFAAITTATSCGAVNGMHDSMLPLGGFVPMFLIQLGEVVFGGVGSGLYTILLFAILAVFIAGLMIGRTPEYLCKKIEAFEMKMTSLAILITPFLILLGTSIALTTKAGTSGIANPGPHGFSEVLYAFSSTANNNGSAFAGLDTNTYFYNTILGIVMWCGRFGFIIPVLAIAGSLAEKQRIAITPGTFPTHGLLFVILLMGAAILVGALTYIPALALGPIVEHLILFTQGFTNA